jgi:hypothetical protein
MALRRCLLFLPTEARFRRDDGAMPDSLGGLNIDEGREKMARSPSGKSRKAKAPVGLCGP